MDNCYVLYINGRVFCVTDTREKAARIAVMLDGLEPVNWKIESSYIPNLSIF